MKKIALILDNKNRDLDGICLIAKCLTDAGYKIAVIPYNLMQFELYLQDFDFVLFNFIRNYNHSLVREITSANIPAGVSDTEGGVFVDIKSFFDTWPENVDKIKNFYYFFWGKELCEFALKNALLEPVQAYVTGCPRFDVYAKFGEKYASEILEDGGYVLFNTNYPLASPKFNSVQKELTQSKISPSQYDRFCSYREIQLKERDAVVNLINYITQKVDIKIIVRPHPFEDGQFYEEAFAANRFVKVNSEGTVKDIIQNASLVVQRGCSTGFETRLLGKKSLSPNWMPFQHSTLVDEGNIFFENKDALLSYIINHTDDQHKSIDENTKQHIDKYFYKIDGNSSYRVASHIANIIRGSERQFFLKKFKIKSLIKRILYYFVGFSEVSFLRSYYREIDLWKKSGKYFNAQDIKEKCDHLGIALDINEPTKSRMSKFQRCAIQITGAKV